MGVKDEEISARFEDLCLEINMDKSTRLIAWEEFRKLSVNYTLEGDDLLWLVCALYVACRPHRLNGNRKSPTCVSLSRLLRSAKSRVGFVFPRSKVVNSDQPDAEKWKFVLIQFFDKMKKWAEMASLPKQLLIKIEQLERNFNVSTVIFKKMRALFLTIFNLDDVIERREKRKRRSPCTVHDLYRFCWTTFVYVKSNFPGIGDDLVNSVHLLLCCLDWLYSECVVLKRVDLLNPNFPPLANINMEEKLVEVPCIIKYLCQNTDGVEMEAKVIKQHYWKPFLEKLVLKKILRGRSGSISGVLEIGNFESNLRGVDDMYEEYLLSGGDFDERVLLGDPQQQDTTKRVPVRLGATDDVDGAVVHMMTSEGSRDLSFDQNKSDKKESPNLMKLLSLMKERESGPGQSLIRVLGELNPDLLDEIQTRLGELCRILSHQNESDQTEIETTTRNVDLAKRLYYKLLENIVDSEQNRLKGKNVDFNQLLSQEIFHQSLFACSMEIVLFSSNSETNFPWIIDVYELKPFYFYKIIESVVKTEEGLSRDIVRHLNWIEEQIMEQLAWENGSPLWKMVWSSSVPTCEQVMFPNQLEREVTGSPSLDKLANSLRFGEAVPNPKRRLFTTSLSGPGGSRIITTKQVHVTAQPQPGDTEPKTFTFQTAISDGRQVLIPVQLVPIRKPEKPQRRGSLAIFFRKVYHLTSVRLRVICERLHIDEELLGKIWTCFEYCLVKNVDLLKDRHLDQMLMCAVYIVCRVTDNTQQFHEIISAYRWQPQAQSSTYRDILIRPGPVGLVSDKMAFDGDADRTLKDVRGDLVKFYNEVFVKKMKKFAMKFRDDSLCPAQTPLPLVRGLKVSSRQLSSRHSVYVSPIKGGETEVIPCTKLRYCFEESFSCDLRFINKMLQTIDVTKKNKRPLQDENENETDESGEPHFLKRIRTSALSAIENHETPPGGAADQGLVLPVLREKLMGLVRDRNSTQENAQ